MLSVSLSVSRCSSKKLSILLKSDVNDDISESESLLCSGDSILMIDVDF